MAETIKCLANREIGVIESTGGVVVQYLAIQKVEGVSIDPVSVVGEAGSSRSIIQRCGRCVGSRRKCDLSQSNLYDLNPQI